MVAGGQVAQSTSALGKRDGAQPSPQQQPDGDAQSVITVDRLKKFNDIQGTVAGNATDEIAAREVEFAEENLEPGQGEEGCGLDADDYEARDEERDEVLSQQV